MPGIVLLWIFYVIILLSTFRFISQWTRLNYSFTYSLCHGINVQCSRRPLKKKKNTQQLQKKKGLPKESKHEFPLTMPLFTMSLKKNFSQNLVKKDLISLKDLTCFFHLSSKDASATLVLCILDSNRLYFLSL